MVVPLNIGGQVERRLVTLDVSVVVLCIGGRERRNPLHCWSVEKAVFILAVIGKVTSYIGGQYRCPLDCLPVEEESLYIILYWWSVEIWLFEMLVSARSLLLWWLVAKRPPYIGGQ